MGNGLSGAVGTLEVPRDMARHLLLISNSTQPGQGYLEHCADELAAFLGGVRAVLFVPYALHDLDAYTATARSGFAALGLELTSVHNAGDPVAAVRAADAIFVGGGNTFRLLDRMHRTGLVDAIRDRVAAGARYVGTSAGTNVAGPTIKTTNDMPIVQPPTFEAIGLVPFNINPHYVDRDPDVAHGGETREQRIAEFHEENPEPVVGLREQTMLLVDGDAVELRGGTAGARVFRRGHDARECRPGDRLDSLL
jgi:dipeptidase E